MAIPPKQIGQSAETNLLWNISKQLDNLRKTSSIVDPALLVKIDELITVSSEIEISAENINLNTDDLETLIAEGNALLEQIKDNTAAVALSDTTFQDITGQLFVYRDNGVDTPIAYKIPDWTVYTPEGAVTAATVATIGPLTQSELLNSELTVSLPAGAATETGVQAVVTALGTPLQAGGSIVVTSSSLPTGASTSVNQTNGNQKTRITDGLNDVTVFDGGVGYKGLVTSIGPTVFISSPSNSTTTQLAGLASFNGLIVSCFNQPAVQINLTSDKNMTLLINQYIDSAGTRKSDTFTYQVIANQGLSLCLPLAGNFINVVVTNSAGASTTSFSLDTTFGTMESVDTYGNQPISIGQQAYGITNSVFVGGSSQPQLTLTNIAGSAYAAGNVVGGLITLTGALQTNVLSGTLESITIAIKSLQTASFKLYLFKGVPSTTFTDKTTPSIQAVDAAKILDVYNFSTPDNGLGNNVTIYVADSLNRTFISETTSVYFVLVTLGTCTFTTINDVVLTVGILKD
jgi:hypothetical protein